MTIPAISMADVKRMIIACYNANEPLFILGEPGMGKTALFEATAKELGIGYIPNILSQKDPVDVGGMRVPDPTTGILKHYVPEDLPIEGARKGTGVVNAGQKKTPVDVILPNLHPEKGILHYDEINVVAMLMQATAYGIINERRVGQHRIKPGWVPMASGNNTTDRSAAQKMSLALANRFNIQRAKPDLPSWLEQYGSANVEPEGCAYLRFRPDNFHVMPKDLNEVRFPSARSWTKAFKFIHEPAEFRRKVIAGYVGDTYADDFEAFWRIMEKAITFDQIIADPAKAPVPDEHDMGLYYAVVAMLGRSVDKKTMDRAMIYVDRLAPDYQVALINDATGRKPELKATRSYGTWQVKHQAVTL